MEVRRAMALFRIQGRIPIEDLNTAFRGLVKKYHPDKVRDYPEWAHERMAEINDAYESLAEWIASPPKTAEEPHRGGSRDAGKPAAGAERYDEADASFRPYDAPPLSGKAEELFRSALSLFFDGLGLYYQYGLDNPAYRNEGVRRFRYREALRTVMKGRDALEESAARTRHPAVRAAARFSRLTAADMDMGLPAFPPAEVSVRRLDERLVAARKLFDGAVKAVLFPELVPDHLRSKTVSGLYSCYAEFVVYLTMFPDGERRRAAVLATARYDAFMDMLEFKNAGHLAF